MKIGVIKEIKDNENRVALTPAGAKALAEAGHTVLVQEGAGAGSGFSDQAYLVAGAKVVATENAWNGDLVMKVKEPLESEHRFLAEQIIFTYFHLAGVTRTLAEALVSNKTTAIAYETVKDDSGRLPLLAPMSAVAGNMAITIGNYYLAKFNRGRGTLLGSVLGERYGKVVVIGDGVVGRHAAKTAAGVGANVFIVGRHPERVAKLRTDIASDLTFVLSDPENIAAHVEDSDLVVGAVLHAGAKAPRVVSEDMVKRMQPGAVVVDVSIDQGGCIETSRPTSHSEPVFEKHGVTHYCVTNMPGAYPRTSTIALTNATLPYALKLANQGISALREDAAFSEGLNTYRGHITYKSVAETLDLMAAYRPFTDIDD